MIKVETFLPQTPVLIFQNLPDQLSKVSDLKYVVGAELHLLESSLDIFGLFCGGSLGNPTRLLKNDSPLPLSTTDTFFLQRLSFSREIEGIASVRDYRALELLYWEICDQICTSKVRPPLTENQRGSFQNILENSGATFTKKYTMLQTINFFNNSCGLYYWELYYRSEYCTLKGLVVTAASPSITKGCKVHVALGSRGVTFLSPRRCPKCEGIIAQFPWIKVRSITSERQSQTVTFTVLIDNVAEELATKILREIPVESSNFEYIHSIALHVLNIQNYI